MAANDEPVIAWADRIAVQFDAMGESYDARRMREMIRALSAQQPEAVAGGLTKRQVESILAEVLDEFDDHLSVGAFDEIANRIAAQPQVAVSDYLPDGTRVLWQSSIGTEFPGTIIGYNPASYNCLLDDGCKANGYARGRFKRLPKDESI